MSLRSISSGFGRYGLAVLAIGLGYLLRVALVGSVGELPTYITFYPAVVFTALLAGAGPGVLATGLAAFIAWRWILPPTGLFSIEYTHDAVGLGLFCAMGVLISLVVSVLRPAAAEPVRAELRKRGNVGRFALIFGAIVALTLGSTFIVYWAGLRVSDANVEVSKSRQILATLETTLSTLKDAETGQRGFVLTGDEAYLEPYTAARRRIAEDLTQLQHWAQTRDVSPPEAKTVARLAQARLAEAEHVVQLRRAQGFDAALAAVRSNVGKRTMDELREHIGTVEAQKNRDLAYWQRRRDSDITLRTMVVIATAMIDLAFLAWAFRRISSATALTQRQKELLAVTLASIGDAVIVTDVGGRVTFLNSEAERLTGWTSVQAADQPLSAVFRIVNEQTRQTVEDPAVKVLRLGGVVGLANHTMLIARDGRETPIDDSGAPISQPGGRAHGVVLVFRDVTERRQREARIARLTKLYVVLSRVNEAIVRIRDEQPLCQEVCRIVAEDGGFPLAWIGRVEGRRVVPAASAGPATDYLEQVRIETDGEFGSGPTGTCIREDRTAVNEDFDSNPLTAAWREAALKHGFRASAALPVHQQDRIAGALTLYAAEPGAFDAEQIGLLEALSADVSYALDAMRLEKLRAEAEQSLRESELRFRTLANAMPQLAWIARPDGWVYWYNVRWYEYTGTTPEQVEGWGWQSVHDPQVLSAVMERWKASLATGEPVDMTFPLRGADGVFRPFLTRVVPLKDAQGRVVQWFGTSTDISAQKAIEEALATAKASADRAKAAAEDATRAKDHFLAVLSHELRTPLTPVLAAASMLQREAGLSGEVREDLEMIRRNAELEARLIDDLLDLTRIARGKVALNRRPVELVSVLARAVEVCRPDIDARQLQFAFKVNCQGAVVDADAARLQQVFWNILKNAIKFTPGKGWIRVRCWVEDGRAAVEISDSGIGIEAEALPRVFSAFEQADRAITRQFGGLGLGLAISKALVEMHGGTIAARSAGKNRGATFTVELPAIGAEASERPPARAPQERSAQRPGRRRVMLVEDHVDTLRIMAHMLRRIGFEVRTAADVASALEQLAQEPCDLLISDLGLPDGSGLDLMKALRARGDTVPGIALSGYGQEEDVRRSQEAGFAEHVTKPVELDQLASAIAAVLHAGVDTLNRA